MALFDIDNVKFSSRSQEVIKGISLQIESGTVTGLMGKSGSGKSTLLKLIAGILVPSAGKVFFEGNDIQAMNKTKNLEFRKKCAFVFQDSALWANQDIQQNLNLPLQTLNPDMGMKERLQKIQEICDVVKYERPLNLRPIDLSMGEQKKIAFARALINNPEVLFLDECTESLDKKGGAIMLEILDKFIKNGHTIIYVSHSTSFINAIGGTHYFVEEGLLSS